MKENLSFVLKLIQILLVFGTLYSYAMFQGGFVSWFLFYSFLPLFVYLFLLLLYPISKWSVKRTLSNHVKRAGESITVDIDITRKFAFPIYYCVIEEFFPSSINYTSIGHQDYKYLNQPEKVVEKRMVKKITFPWFKRNFHYQYTLTNLPRGEHKYHAIRIKTGDFFGFIKKGYVFPVTNRLLVYPRYRTISIKKGLSRFDEGASTSLMMNSKNNNMVSGVREYAPGDRFSWIDWKTTARKDSVMTKEFEQEKSSSILLILDTVDYEGLNRLTFDASIELTFSLIESFNKKTSQLAFLALGAERVFIPFQQDFSKQELMNHFLAKVRPGGDSPFHHQLADEVKKVPYGSITMIVITYLNSEIKQSIDMVKQKSNRIIIYLIKPSSKITSQDYQMIQQLSVEGVMINLITEEKLITQEFEVNI
ncbi:DUF58 domain-containing protein [Aquibacillus saliphilus]|uniref:DUF58 domain-containing protein n=1 Tax=Aquibacillus saliphilus TaxID=1909422 RepID=UPI001CEFE46B|nr:DUF58 domain-containing protein [Aquibacillus saliphilus]